MSLARPLVQSLIRFVPDSVILPIISGPARGMFWQRDACNHCFWLGTYERQKCEAIVRELRSNSIFYDIGANSGYYSLVASRRCSAVYAFEPMPRNIRRLKENVRLNRRRNVTLLELAISNHSSTMQFRYGSNTENGRLDRNGDISVTAATLDELVQSIPVPDVMKVDIEGAEFDALQGASSILEKVRPIVFLATHGDEIHRMCVDFLTQRDYRIEFLQHDELLARPC